MFLHYSPFWLKAFYSRYIWHIPTDDKKLFLTFDDGPIPEVTEFVLNTLKNFNAKATFFCIGDNVRKHPDIFQMLLDQGHSVGNHTFNHLKGWKTPDDVYLKNFNQCQELTGTSLFRPPYGRIRKSQVRDIRSAYPDTNIIMWDVLSGDFDLQLRPEKCLKNVLKHTKNGSIVVFHDSLKAAERMQYALPRMLEHFSRLGYRFEPL